MKKTVNISVLFAVMVIFLSGCGQNKTITSSSCSSDLRSSSEVTSSNDNLSSHSVNNISSSSKLTENSDSNSSINKQDYSSDSVGPQKKYIGSFKIIKYIPTGVVEGFSKKSANDYIGETIIVSETSIKTSRGNVDNPQLTETFLTDKEFYSEWNITFKNAGFTGDKITEVTIKNYNIKDGTEDRIGSNFLITTDNQFYTFIGGALFKLKKL